VVTRRAPVGVRWISSFPGDGYGDAALQYVSALDALGVPVTWTPLAWFPGMPGLSVLHDYDGPMAHLAHRRIDHDVVVFHMPMNGASEWCTEARGRRAVAFTTWETDCVPEGWLDQCNTFDAVLVPSTFNGSALVAAGCRTEVRVIPHIVPAPRAVEPAHYSEIGDRFTFYTVGTWSTRKAMPDTIVAFLDAFTGTDDVGLVVKTSATDQHAVARVGRGLPTPGPSRWPTATWPAFAALLAGRRSVPRMHLVAGQVPAAEIDALHTRGDCFVSLTRSEGWGLCISDALAFGNPAIVTGWGGQLDHLGRDYPLLVDFDLIPTVDDEPDDWFEAREGYRWARARHDHAVDLLRWVAANPERAAAIGRDRGGRVAREFTPEHVGRVLLDALAAAADAA
jgi:glycosyltransferase involved in cell wall biosynthesis